MFGYVKPFKPQLRVCEFDTYKAVYCGLCGQLGKSFGPAARLTLSYDFTFLCMLHHAVGEERASFGQGRCFANPLKKVPLCAESEPLRFAADTAIIMIYYKLLDNMHDGAKIARAGWSCFYPIVRSAWKQAARSRPACDAMIARSVEQQSHLEKKQAASVDEACEPTAAAMAGICRLLSSDEKQQRVLEQIGYYMGRYVYLCDALDDLERDLRSGDYNPFLLAHGISMANFAQERDKVYAAARGSLYATIAEVIMAWELLDGEMFRPILDNTVNLGMRKSVDEILSKKEKIQ